MSAGETVFEIDDLRKYIFTFLRSYPHKSCQECNCVLEWERGIKKVNYLEWATLKPMCCECFRNIFFNNTNSSFGCNIM
uniref:Uncharacterized protein n=1 Tax=viral metagenome TaxID=1070528 RepID=A0A6C0C1K9_9ZZZZ